MSLGIEVIDLGADADHDAIVRIAATPEGGRPPSFSSIREQCAWPQPSTSVIEPNTILRQAAAIFSPMAMLAGMQLNLFTALKDGPRTAAKVA